MSFNKNITRGLILEVPFAEKDDAKKLGARWDPEIRKWFVPEGLDPLEFRRWMPSKSGAKTAAEPRVME